MSRPHPPVIDFAGWRRRRPRCPQPPRRRRPSRQARRPPGAAGVIASVLALLCVVPAAGQVRIQEVLYDAVGTEAAGVFTELSGPPGTSLDGWSLAGINGDGGATYRTVSLDGASIPADGILVVATNKAGPGLAAVRDLAGNVEWQNGPDAVQLLNGQQVVDALQYGDAGAHNSGEGTPAPRTAAGQSLSRDAAGTDTGDNAADFSVLEVPTPGTAATQGFTISLPDTTVSGGDTLVVPVRFTDSSAGDVLAAELFVSFDGGLLSPLGVKPAGLFDARKWQLASHTLEGAGDDADTLRIALATDTDTLDGDGTLLRARFRIADLRRPAATGLTIEHLALNDGALPTGATDGAVTLVGSDAVVAITPSRVAMHDSLRIAVTDPDVDRDPKKRDTLDIYLRQRTARSAVGTPDTFAAVETGPSSGTFASRLAILHKEGAPKDEILPEDAVWTLPGRRLQFCFYDSLDSAGLTTRPCTLLALPAHDGRLDATVVAEPGDTLWMRLIDADANERPKMLDTASVSLPYGKGTRSVDLVEASLSDSVFFGHLVTGARFTVAGGDTLRPSYRDKHNTTDKEVRISDTTHVLGLFGDADANGRLQAFDASRILNHVLEPVLGERDSLAANVDSLAPFGAITPFDAALVLQQRVGLRRRFPVQESVAANHPRAAPEASGETPGQETGRPLAAPERRLELRHRADHLALWVDERAGIVSGDLMLRWEKATAARPEPAPDLQGFVVASGPAPGPEGPRGLRVVLAGARPASGPGELLRIRPLDGADLAGAEVAGARFNDGRIPARVPAPAAGPPVPARFALHPNHPNPFNAGTVIPYELAGAGPVRLTVVNLVGQEVRRLARGHREAGAHRARWDGKDGEGRPAATGVYLLRLEAGDRKRTRRMLLLR